MKVALPFAFVAIFLATCTYQAPVADPSDIDFSGSVACILSDLVYPDGTTPCVVKIINKSKIPAATCVDFFVNMHRIALVRGVGATFTNADATISVTASDGSPAFSSTRTRPPRDTIVLDTPLWPESLAIVDKSDFIIIRQTITVPAGQSLLCASGAIILTEDTASILIAGTITTDGTPADPVVFAPLDQHHPWGGIVLTGTGSFRYTLFTGGGGNTAGPYVIGHSKTQAVLHAEQANLTCRNCYFIFNNGKGIQSLTSTVDIDSSLFAFDDVGNEHHFSSVNIRNSSFQFIPDSTRDFVDDDNDGLYLYNTFGPATDSVWDSIVNCTFYHTKDDAIDHNEAFAAITGCHIEDIVHEGLAGSQGNIAQISNSLIVNCDQGVEAGYGAPLVQVDHCVITGCGNAVRFGDAYTVGCYGTITALNSVLYNNIYNARNLDYKTGTAIDGALTLRNCLLDKTVREADTTSIVATPRLDAYNRVIPGSPGSGAASDGLSVGLLPYP